MRSHGLWTPPRLDQLLTCHSGSIGDEVYYRSTRLMLQLVFFVSVFLRSRVFTEHFRGFGFITHVFGASGFGVSFLSLFGSGVFFFGLTPRYHDSCGSRRESSPF